MLTSTESTDKCSSSIIKVDPKHFKFAAIIFSGESKVEILLSLVNVETKLWIESQYWTPSTIHFHFLTSKVQSTPSPKSTPNCDPLRMYRKFFNQFLIIGSPTLTIMIIDKVSKMIFRSFTHHQLGDFPKPNLWS